jgi:ParB family chromosome partitioning protein
MTPTAPTKKRTPVKAAEPSTSTNTAVDALVPASVALRDISVDLIDSHPDNPRKDLGDLTELAASIKEQGVLEPVLVVPGAKGSGKFAQHYTVIAGHRRTAAARAAGVATVPAIIREGMTEAEQIEVMLVENLHRSDLTVFEEAHGMQALFAMGRKRTAIAKRTGRAVATVGQRLRLANLPMSAESAVANHTMTIDEALTLADISDRSDEVYVDLVKKLNAGALKGWAITEALKNLDRVEANTKWMEYIDSTGVKQLSAEEWRSPEFRPAALGDLGIEPEDHTNCPGARVRVGEGSWSTAEQQTYWYCEDAEKHHPDLVGAQAPGARKETAEEVAKREAREQLAADLESASSARWSWICHLMTEPGTARAQARALLVAAVVDRATAKDPVIEVGATLADGMDWPTDPALALALSMIPSVDAAVPADAWDYDYLLKKVTGYGNPAGTRASALAWWKVLEAAGYTLTPVEVSMREALDQAGAVDEGADATGEVA